MRPPLVRDKKTPQWGQSPQIRRLEGSVLHFTDSTDSGVVPGGTRSVASVFGALRFVPYGGRARGGHDKAWPSIEWRLGPAATRDRGPPMGDRDLSLEGRAPSRPFLGPCGLSRMAAGRETAMTKHGPPLNGVLGPRPRGTVALQWGIGTFPWRDALRRVRSWGLAVCPVRRPGKRRP